MPQEQVVEVDISSTGIVEGQRRLLAQLFKAGITEPGMHNVTIQHAAFVQLAVLREIERVRFELGPPHFSVLQILKIRKIHNPEPASQNIEIELCVRLVGNPIPDGEVFSVSDHLMRTLDPGVQHTLRALVGAESGRARIPLRSESLQEIGLTSAAIMALTQTPIPPIYGLPSVRTFATAHRDDRGSGGEGIALNISLVP